MFAAELNLRQINKVIKKTTVKPVTINIFKTPGKKTKKGGKIIQDKRDPKVTAQTNKKNMGLYICADSSTEKNLFNPKFLKNK